MQVRAFIGREKAGEAESRSISVDGKTFSCRWEVSRLLTGTVYEIGQGLFSKDDTLKREGRIELKVSFSKELSIKDYDDAQEFVVEVKRRADLINKAFEDKYPAINSTGIATVTLESETPAAPVVVDGTFT